MQKVLNLYPETKLCVTGHSLGGALSVLCGIRLALNFPDHDVQVINFGCPKVGNAAFAKLVNARKNLRVHRVAHERDLVTRVPNMGLSPTWVTPSRSAVRTSSRARSSGTPADNPLPAAIR